MNPKRTILSAVSAVVLSAATIVGASAQPATSSVNGDWLNGGGGNVPYYGYTSRRYHAGRATGYRRYHRLQMNAAPATSSVNGDWLNDRGGNSVPYYGYTRY